MFRSKDQLKHIHWFLAGTVVFLAISTVVFTLFPLYNYVVTRESFKAQTTVQGVSVFLDNLLSDAQRYAFASAEEETLGYLMQERLEGKGSIRAFRGFINELMSFAEADFLEILGMENEVISSAPFWQDRIGEDMLFWSSLLQDDLSAQINTLVVINDKLFAVSTRYIFHELKPIGIMVLGFYIDENVLRTWGERLGSSIAVAIKENKVTITPQQNMPIHKLAEIRETQFTKVNEKNYLVSTFPLISANKKTIGTVVVTSDMDDFFDSLSSIVKSVLTIFSPLLIGSLVIVFFLGKKQFQLNQTLSIAMGNLKETNKELESSRKALKRRVDDMLAIHDLTLKIGMTMDVDTLQNNIQKKSLDLLEDFKVRSKFWLANHDVSDSHSDVVWEKKIFIGQSKNRRCHGVIFCCGERLPSARELMILETFHSLSNICLENILYLEELLQKDRKKIVQAAAHISDKLNSPMLTVINVLEKSRRETKKLLLASKEEDSEVYLNQVKLFLIQIEKMAPLIEHSVNSIQNIRVTLDKYRESGKIEATASLEDDIFLDDI